MRACFSLFCLVLGLVLASGCKSTPPPKPLSAHQIKAQHQMNAASRLSEQTNWPMAVVAWAKAAGQFALLNDVTNQVVCLHHQAVAHRAQRQNSNACVILQQAELLSQQMTNTTVWWRIQIDMAQLENLTGRAAAALDRLRRLQLSAAAIPQDAVRGLFLHELGVNEMEQNQWTEAGQHLAAAATAFQRAKDDRGLAATLANQAQLQMRKGDSGSAVPLWQQARVQFQQLGDPPAIAWCLLREGQAILDSNASIAPAEHLLRQAAHNYALLQDRQKQSESLKALAGFLQRAERPEEAQSVLRELDALTSLP